MDHQRNIVCGPPAQPAPSPTENDIFHRATGRTNQVTAAVLAAILLYWLVYFWQDALAKAGDYRYFSYTFHEAYSLGILLVPAITLLWLAMLLVRSTKHRQWRKNALPLCLLAALLLGQLGYLYDRSQIVHHTSWTEAVDIPDEYHVVIEGSNGTVTLSTTPTVTALLRTDGTIYGFYYEQHRRDPDEGRLNGIWDSAD